MQVKENSGGRHRDINMAFCFERPLTHPSGDVALFVATRSPPIPLEYLCLRMPFPNYLMDVYVVSPSID